MRNLQRALLVLYLFVSAFEGCAPDAPHDNPLDPASPNRKTDGNLSGNVLIVNSLTVGIAGALVTIEGTNLAELTAANGNFSFSDAPSGNITIVITKSTYLSDTLRINLPVGGNIDTSVHLDALPQVSNAQVVTSKVDHWYPGPVYTASISADVSDPDGSYDIGNVYAVVDSVSFGMSYNNVFGNYQVIINADSLPDQSLQWLVGKQFNVFAIDHENGVGQSPGFYVTRIIESEPSPTSPFQDTTLGHPKLDWNPPVVSFEYTYQLQVVSLAGGTIWSKVGISSSILDYSYPDSLPSLPGGNYYWTVGVVDQFGNSASSKEAAFVVSSQ